VVVLIAAKNLINTGPEHFLFFDGGSRSKGLANITSSASYLLCDKGNNCLNICNNELSLRPIDSWALY
jgi:hypothetical protein